MRILLVPALAISLAGCVTPGPSPSPISEVQTLAQRICGFVPTAGVIDALLNAGGFATYVDLAKAICSVVAPQRIEMRTGRSAPSLRGVAITGRFVR
jgi:hypothetical protein